jgi:hypothetical protein
MVMDYSAIGKDVIEVDIAGITDPPYDELFPDWPEIEKRRRRK